MIPAARNESRCMPDPDLVPAPFADGRQSPAALAITRGVRRLLWTLGLASIPELSLPNGRRADIAALSEKGEVWIVEVKSSVVDFRSDSKWPEYRDYCDRLLFAVDRAFPTEILPRDAGVIVADAYGAAVIRDAPVTPLAGARRKLVALRFARVAALRLHGFADPEFGTLRID